jgi:ABC-type glutathione transport system ATPase component
MAPLLLNPPTVLVADEPTLGLAPRIVEQMLALFTQLRDNGTTLLLAEEWARSVLDAADQVILLELGRVVWSGPRHSLDDQQLAAIFLGSAAEVVTSSQAAQQETESDEVPAHADGTPTWSASSPIAQSATTGGGPVSSKCPPLDLAPSPGCSSGAG